MLGELSVHDWAMAAVGFGLFFKSFIDVLHRRSDDVAPRHCGLTAKRLAMLEDLHAVLCANGSRDGHDGLPRYYSRDMLRDALGILRRIDSNLQTLMRNGNGGVRNGRNGS